MPLADIPLLEFPPCDHVSGEAETEEGSLRECLPLLTGKSTAIYEGVVLDRLEQVSSENEIDEVLASMVCAFYCFMLFFSPSSSPHDLVHFGCHECSAVGPKLYNRR